MCGIIGALAFDPFEKKSQEKIRNEANIFITTQLLQATVDRGKDATGISLLWADGNYAGLKMGIPSPEFIARFGTTEKDFEGFMNLWREYPKMAKAFIGHCRKSSVGNSYDNKNNHPIQIGDIILIHNGTLTNHEKIFDKLKCNRIGDVDSEAIGQLLHHYTNGGVEPFTPEIIKETTRRLHGSYSVLAMSGNNPYQVAQFRDGRPAEMVLVKPLKMVYIASEKKFLENVLFEYNKMAKLFATASKFPYLRQADVEFKMLQDDSLALWDLTTPITDETTIEDLYTWEKVPLRVDKVWDKTTTTTTTNTNTTWNTNQSKSTGTEVTVKNSTKKTGTDSAGDDPDGLVWSKSLNKFKTEKGIQESKKFGAVTIDVEKGEINPTDDTGKADDIDVKEVDDKEVENLIVGGAEINELAIETASDALNSVDGGKKSSSSPEGQSDSDDEDNVSDTVEVDMTADPEAIKAATEFVEKGLIKYENDDEVVVDLEVSDAAVLRPLPVYALANRIKKFIFKQGFIAGFIARKKAEKNDAVQLGEKVVKADKLEAAEKKIRIMKMAVKVLAAGLDLRTKGNTSAAKTAMIQNAILDGLGKSSVKADLTSAFSVGDIKNIPMLDDIQKELNKEN